MIYGEYVTTTMSLPQAIAEEQPNCMTVVGR